MYQVGIDIGSSATKIVVIEEGKIIKTILRDMGFSCQKSGAVNLAGEVRPVLFNWRTL